jgi:hypothetical protein
MKNRKSKKFLEKEISELLQEDLERGELIHFSYDELADGGRRPHRPRKIDPATADAIRRIWE